MKNLKQIVCTILTAGIMVTSLPVYSAAAAVGDLNDDGVIDKNDVKLFAQYFAGWPMAEETKEKMLAAGDVNGDEAVTRADAMELARSVNEWSGYEKANEYTVTFDANADGVVGMPENQKVAAGEYAVEPEAPRRDGYVFTGWYMEKDEYIEIFSFSNTPISSDITLYAYWKDISLDTDGDGLPDYIEEKLGLDPNNHDSDGNGVADCDEDFDEDGIPNGKELEIGSNLALKDSDNDDLEDADEFRIGTNVINSDTDGDGASDGLEVKIGTNPLVYDESFTDSDASQPMDEYNPVAASVIAEVPGSAVGTVVVNPVLHADNYFISQTIPGYLGYAYEFDASEQIISGTITFEYDKSLGALSDEFQPRIYYLNEETQGLEELPDQRVMDGMIEVDVEHFSTYILLDRTDYNSDHEWRQAIIRQTIAASKNPTLDTNNDGIYDIYDEMIHDGILVLKTGSRNYIGYNFCDSSKLGTDEYSDYDGDGIVNGAEIDIYEDAADGSIYIHVISDPTMEDSDNDGYTDSEERGLSRKSTAKTDPLKYTYNAEAIKALYKDDDYAAYLLERLVAEDGSEYTFQFVYSMLDNIGRLTSRKEIYKEAWLDYLNNYSEELIADSIINYEEAAYIDDVNNFSDDITEQITEFVLSGDILDEIQKAHLEALIKTRNKLQSDLNSLMAQKHTMSKKEWKKSISAQQKKVRELLNANDIEIGTYTAKYVDPLEDYNKKFTYVTMVISAVEGYERTQDAAEFYAQVNANIDMLRESKELFRELKGLYSDASFFGADFSVVGAAEEILEVLEKEGEEFKQTGWDALASVLSPAKEFLIDKLFDAIGACSFVTFIGSLIVNEASSRAYAQSMIFSAVYLTNAAKSHLNSLLDSKYQTNDMTASSNALTHLAQLRLYGEYIYAQSRTTSKDNLLEKIVNLQSLATQLNISLSDKLISHSNSLVRPNVKISVYDDIEYDNKTGDYTYFNGGAIQYFVYINGEIWCTVGTNITTSVTEISTYLEPDHDYLIQVVENHAFLGAPEKHTYYYRQKNLYVSENNNYTVSVTFDFSPVGSMTGQILYEGKVVNNAMLYFREGHNNMTGDIVAISKYPYYSRGDKTYRVVLPKGYYTVEVASSVAKKTYYNVEFPGHFNSPVTGYWMPNVTEYDFNLSTPQNVVCNVYAYYEPQVLGSSSAGDKLYEGPAANARVYVNDKKTNIVTGADGKCSLSLEPGEYKITFQSDTNPNFSSCTRYVTIGDSVQYQYDFYLFGPKYQGVTYSVNGSVNDIETGAAITDATVKFRKDFGNKLGEYVDVLVCTSNELGDITTTLPAGCYTAEVSCNGYETEYVDFLLAGYDLDITLVDDFSAKLHKSSCLLKYALCGEVTDGVNPLGGVTVSLSTVTRSTIGNLSTETVSDGTYSFLVPVGTYLIQFSKDGYSLQSITVPVDGSSKEVIAETVAMPPEEALPTDFSLTHTAADGTVTNLLASPNRSMYNGPAPQTWTLASPSAWQATMSGDCSWFTLDKKSGDAGTMELKLQLLSGTDSARTGTITFKTLDDGKTYSIKLNQTPAIFSGITTHIDGTAMDGVTVTVSNANYTSEPFTTGADGKFTFALPNGWYDLTLSKDGYEPTTFTSYFEMNGQNVDIGNCSLPMYLTGTIINDNAASVNFGNPVADVAVEILDGNGTSVGTAVTDIDGVFGFNFYSAGAGYTVKFTKNGFVDKTDLLIPITPHTSSLGQFTITEEDETEPYAMRQFNGHTYLVFDIDMTWEEAEEFCESVGGHLATISSGEENAFLMSSELHSRGSHIMYEPKYWIGYTDCETEGVWKWVNDEETVYTNWNSDAPVNESGNEDYAALVYRRGLVTEVGKWNNYKSAYAGSSQSSAFICEWDSLVDETALLIGSGTCGDNLTWTMSALGILTISGTGDMYDYSYSGSNTPWMKWENNRISSIVVENGITRIGDNAFYGLYNTHGISLRLSNTLKSIGTYAFCNTAVAEVAFPKSLESIGASAFQATNLREVIIPVNVQQIGYYTDDSFYTHGTSFEYCEDLEAINVLSANPYFTSVDGVLYTEDMSMLLTYPAGKNDESFTIPENVTEVFYDAFLDNDPVMRELTISDTLADFNGIRLESIEAYHALPTNPEYSSADGVLFSKDMSRLYLYPRAKSDTKYTIPHGVKILDYYSFEYCDHLLSVTIPDTVIEISYTFLYCDSLNNVIIPENVVWLNGFSNCACLTDLYFMGNAPRQLYGIPSGVTLHYTEGKTGWGTPNHTTSDGTVCPTQVFDPASVDLSVSAEGFFEPSGE